ncbi:MAG: replication-associated recombination protein A [Clostridia bacterium]|nr:replication-associated recombination protein A [Clostridia bacterium]
MRTAQLADLLRPESLDDLVGQDHLFGRSGIIRRMLSNGRITNMIFFGPPGTGKTTAARIIAKASGMTYHQLNATTASLQDVKDLLQDTKNIFGTNGLLLYLDEIQYFNKRQQQSLLESMESGDLTLIASTTENPHFCIHHAVISRSSLFAFHPIKPESILPVLQKALDYLNQEQEQLPDGRARTVSEETCRYICSVSGGDVRRAISLFENAFFSADDEITIEHVKLFDAGIGDFNSDVHYDLLSCLQKSIRGSDPDATAFYVARLLALGELLSLCRRLQVIANEDIGLANSQAAVVTRSCCESALDLGLPEAALPIAHAAIYLATSPKSNSAYLAVNAATQDVNAGKGVTVPKHLQSPLFEGYKYPHDFPDHYVDQEYLPVDLKGRKYYKPAENKYEQACLAYWEAIKNNKKRS